MVQDFLFFLGVLLLLFAVWVGAGGPNNPGAFSGPFLAPQTGTTTWGGTQISGDTSPFRGKVTLSRNTLGAMQEDEDDEHIVILAAYGNSERVSLAGWKLTSSVSKKTVTLPQATALPRAGRVNTQAEVLLAPGEQAVVVSGRSPIGVSFRENVCTGYFEEHQDFTPALSLSCPRPTEEYARVSEDEDDECLMRVREISQCGTETRSDVSGACEDFIEEVLSYEGCVAAHQNDAGFALATWRLFLNERDELWKRSRETILLLDANNKIVDALSY